jgi:hypothetical protein
MTRSIHVALTLVCFGLVGCGGGGGVSTKKDMGSSNNNMTTKTDMGSKTMTGDMGTVAMPGDMGTVSKPVDMAPVQIVGADKCAAAMDIPLDSPSTDLVANTTKATHDLTGPCTGTTGADVFYTFTLHTRELVYADTFGASWNTSLFFASDCGTTMTTSTTPGDVLCSDDACATTQSQVVALLNPGTYYLVLSGKATGSATVHFQHAAVGRGPLGLLPKGASVQSGTTSGNGSNFDCAGAGAENSYWWLSCPATGGAQTNGSFTGSLCGGAQWDTIAYLQTPATKREICSDDDCGAQSVITFDIPAAAGVNVFTVDGSNGTAKGDYTVTFSRP